MRRTYTEPCLRDLGDVRTITQKAGTQLYDAMIGGPSVGDPYDPPIPLVGCHVGSQAWLPCR